jgi:hypothetical protein
VACNGQEDESEIWCVNEHTRVVETYVVETALIGSGERESRDGERRRGGE